MATKMTGIVSKIVKRVVGSHIIFTSYARNVCLQQERKHVDAGSTSPIALSMNIMIQTVYIHSLLMRHLSSSTTGGGHFEPVMYR